jgi:hypothetical protein
VNTPSLARLDILIQVPWVRKYLRERIVREPSDLLIISPSLLPDPLKDQRDELENRTVSLSAWHMANKIRAAWRPPGCGKRR